VKTINAGLAAHIATRRTKLARCLRLDLQDGTTLGVTDHDKDLVVDLGDGAITYRAEVGAIPSAAATSVGFEVDSLEVSGPVGEAVTLAAVLGGRFRQARARLFDVRWDAPTQWYALLAGKVGEGKVEGGLFTLQIRGASDAYSQTIGRIISPYCSHDFGVFDPPHSRCQATPLTWAATVTAATDALRFEVSWDAGAPTAEQVRNGQVAFATGALAGTRPVEVFDLTGGDTIELYHLLVEAPEVGDTLTVTQGCAKTRPACKAHGQILNAGGFFDLPGTDAYIPVPVPG
jgi:uncharacterized phage protein (TIGR02218 family)